MSGNIEGHWDIVITSIQDIFNSNESLSLNNKYEEYLESKKENLTSKQLGKLKEDINSHKSNIETAIRLLKTSSDNLNVLVDYLKSGDGSSPQKVLVDASSSKVSKTNHKKPNKKVGRSYYTSKFNPSEPIYVGSEVAYKLKNRHFEEWIQCEVMKIMGDGIRFEIRDPEPDENNNPGQTFRATYKEILLIPDAEDINLLNNYTAGSKVLARYPETTTFYPAVVVGTKKNGMVRLKFDGEEEVNKETEAERRLVLPFPER